MILHRERTSEEKATYWYCFSVPVNPKLLLLGSSNKASWCDVHQSQVDASPSAPLPISSVAPHQVHHCQSTLWRITKCTLTNLHCALHQEHHYQSPVCTSSSATFTNLHCAPSTSALFTNLQCYASMRVAPIYTVVLLQLHYSTVNLHLLVTILCDYATRRLCHYATRPFYIINNLAGGEYALLTMKSKFYIEGHLSWHAVYSVM